MGEYIKICGWGICNACSVVLHSNLYLDEIYTQYKQYITTYKQMLITYFSKHLIALDSSFSMRMTQSKKLTKHISFFNSPQITIAHALVFHNILHNKNKTRKCRSPHLYFISCPFEFPVSWNSSSPGSFVNE